jgi:hypothetical protein
MAAIRHRCAVVGVGVCVVPVKQPALAFTIVYWVGVTSNWLPFAHSVLGYIASGWGILMTWFTTLIVVVSFIPTASGDLLPPRQRHHSGVRQRFTPNK